jgi:hypothetical protein
LLDKFALVPDRKTHIGPGQGLPADRLSRFSSNPSPNPLSPFHFLLHPSTPQSTPLLSSFSNHPLQTSATDLQASNFQLLITLSWPPRLSTCIAPFSAPR